MSKVDYHEVARQYSLLSTHYEDWSRIDWSENVKRQGQALDNFITGKGFTSPCRILDFSCGMGTQVTGLACHGHDVTGLDLSEGQIKRARLESGSFDVTGSIKWVVGDALQAASYVEGPFDIILSFGNSLPLFGSLENIRAALDVMYGLLRPGGMILLSLLDYSDKRQTRPHIMQYGRVDNVKRQGMWMEMATWTDEGSQYRSDVYFFFTAPELKVVHYPFPLLYAMMNRELESLLEACEFSSIKYHTKEQVPDFSCPLFEAYKRA